MMRRDLMSLFTRIASWILLYLPIALILLVVIDLLNYIITYGTGIISKVLFGSLSTIVFLIILMAVGDWLGSVSNRIDNEIETQLVGFLLSISGPTPVGRIAEYLNVSVEHARKTFFKVKSKGMLKEFTFDAERMEIIPPFTQTTTAAEKPSYIPPTVTDELIQRAKLIELEKLKAEGKISEEAYKRIREELEGKKS